MNTEQRIAYIQSQVVCAQAEIEGMKALNHERMDGGYTLAYDEAAFLAVPEKYGLTHNQVIAYLMDM